MTLEPPQQEKVLEWLQSKELPRDCPSCGATEDFMGCDVVELPVKRGVKRPSGPGIPVVPLICQVCGHVRFFSAKLMGVVE